MGLLYHIQNFLNRYLMPGPIDPREVDTMDDHLDFERCVAFVLEREGGYINDPSDSGGETKFGISKKNNPSENIKALTIERAKEIYKKRYWDQAGCESLDWPMNLVVFDTAVNMGVGRANGFKVQTQDPVAYLELRTEFYKSLAKRRPKDLKFLKGWLRRVAELRKEAGV